MFSSYFGQHIELPGVFQIIHKCLTYFDLVSTGHPEKTSLTNNRTKIISNYPPPSEQLNSSSSIVMSLIKIT